MLLWVEARRAHSNFASSVLDRMYEELRRGAAAAVVLDRLRMVVSQVARFEAR